MQVYLVKFRETEGESVYEGVRLYQTKAPLHQVASEFAYSCENTERRINILDIKPIDPKHIPIVRRYL